MTSTEVSKDTDRVCRSDEDFPSVVQHDVIYPDFASLLRGAHRGAEELAKQLKTRHNPQGFKLDTSIVYNLTHLLRMAYPDQGLLTAYHEAAHAVIADLFGFRPKWISEAKMQTDRRTSSFFRKGYGLLLTPKSRERGEDFAVMSLAGLVVECLLLERPIEDLRTEPGEEDNVCEDLECVTDYETVHRIWEGRTIKKAFEFNEDVRGVWLRLIEQRAVSIVTNPIVWSRISFLGNLVNANGGYLAGKDLATALRQCRKLPSY